MCNGQNKAMHVALIIVVILVSAYGGVFYGQQHSQNKTEASVYSLPTANDILEYRINPVSDENGDPPCDFVSKSISWTAVSSFWNHVLYMQYLADNTFYVHLESDEIPLTETLEGNQKLTITFQYPASSMTETLTVRVCTADNGHNYVYYSGNIPTK
jgi:hypothetical protein